MNELDVNVNKRRERKNIIFLKFIIIFTLIWAVVNVSSTVSSIADGRSISMHILNNDAEYLQTNSSPEVISVIDNLGEDNIPIFGEWLFSSYQGDSLNYMKMAMGYGSYEPYSLRVAYPYLVGQVSEVLLKVFKSDKKFSVYSAVFIFFNILAFIVSVYLAARILLILGVNLAASVFISFISFLQLGYLKTIYSPMVDQPAILITLIFITALISKNFIWLTLFSIVAILVKDSLIMLGLIPGIYLLIKRDYRYFIVCIIMLISFIGLRYINDTDPLSMQYGWEVSKGDFRLDYFKAHFSSIGSLINLAIGHFYSFGPAWIMALFLIFFSNLKRSDWWLVFALFGLAVLFSTAQVFLASRIARTLTPASIPLFLISFGLCYKYYKSEFDRAISSLLSHKENLD